MIRVLHCIFTTSVGGLEVGVVKLVNHIQSPDIEQGICAFTGADGQNGSCLDAITNSRCRLYQLHRRCGNDPLMVAELLRVIREFRPHVIHTRNWATYLEGALATVLTSTPVLIHGEHGTPSPGRWRHRWAYRLLARRTRIVVTVSEALARHYQDTCRSWATEVRTIHNGVDDKCYVPAADTAAAKAALGLPAGALVAGSVGRLVPVKGFDLLLEATASILKAVPETHLLLVGDGPELQPLQAAAARLGITERVHFAGHKSDVVPYYQAMDVYVNSSHSEGISNGILEALACGVPVVATAVGGSPEILARAGIAGTLVPPEDAAALAAGLSQYLQNDKGRALRRAAGRQAIADHFNLSRMVSQYVALYRAVAEN
jgi:sugar transferase (PEP-CTERM/EpsH1 system associated)